MSGRFRYLVVITFKVEGTQFLQSKRGSIEEPIKTLKEAESFKDILDETVYSAYILDNVKNKVIKTWIKGGKRK